MKKIICKSGLTGWQCRLRKNYKTFEEFESYDRNYGIAERLGFVSARVAWELNPTIQGSTDPSDLKTVGFRTIDKIIWPVDCKYGAPMGRRSIIPNDCEVVDIGAHKKYLVDLETKKSQVLYDCAIRMSPCGAYDFGGAYWGCGKQMRVQYTKDLSYIKFYRRGEE